MYVETTAEERAERIRQSDSEWCTKPIPEPFQPFVVPLLLLFVLGTQHPFARNERRFAAYLPVPVVLPSRLEVALVLPQEKVDGAQLEVFADKLRAILFKKKFI